MVAPADMSADTCCWTLQTYYPVITASSQFDPSLVANLTGPNTTVCRWFAGATLLRCNRDTAASASA
jgi:hypothetical protein